MRIQYTPPTQLNSTVELRRRRRCVLGFILQNLVRKLSHGASRRERMRYSFDTFHKYLGGQSYFYSFLFSSSM